MSNESIRLGAAVLAAITRAGTTRAGVSGRPPERPTLGTVYTTCAGRGATVDTLDKLSRAMGLGSVYRCLIRHFEGRHEECIEKGR